MKIFEIQLAQGIKTFVLQETSAIQPPLQETQRLEIITTMIYSCAPRINNNILESYTKTERIKLTIFLLQIEIRCRLSPKILKRATSNGFPIIKKIIKGFLLIKFHYKNTNQI